LDPFILFAYRIKLDDPLPDHFIELEAQKVAE
jgi:hypothetical protein